MTKQPTRTTPALSKSQIFTLAAAITTIAAAAVFIAIYLLDDPRSDFYNDIELVCVDDTSNMHGFIITVADLARHIRKKQPITCPECDTPAIARAAPCVECNKLMPTGAHNLPPDNCPYCGIAQPYPTISDHASIHTPGAHGEEALIVPYNQDPEPDLPPDTQPNAQPEPRQPPD